MTDILNSISPTTASHYTWGEECDGWHLVRSPSLSVIQERMPPGTREQRHRHARARQFFFVLQGHLVLEVEGTHHALSQGIGLEIPPGFAHTAMNESAMDVSFLVISQPPSHGDRELVGQ
jgi:mannose-6-phosphate isomerase-like protein (cupin superfamily)